MANQALMSTSQASGGPQWQVDIPGLSSMIFAAGSYGLKQLALSGVDIHTIGCMLMIAEFTPACPEFRKLLSKVREQERNDRLWMYRVVEIGAATNFLADQLLKTRAGENVIALLSVSIPVMDEDSCIALLSTLFDCSGVTLDNIPGRNQLASVRKNLASLARKTGFAEKLLHYHHFLKGLLPNQMAESSYVAVPSAEKTPHIIKLLHQLITSGDSHILIHRGIRGAAWVVTYAKFVLGLPVCALNHEAHPVPISGTYEEAKVIIEVGASNESCTLYSKGELQGLVQLDNGSRLVQHGWSVDCSLINFIELKNPGLSSRKEFSRISNFAAIECLNAISNSCDYFEQWTPDATWCRGDNALFPLKYDTYVKSVLSHIHARGLKILEILGFRPSRSGYKFERSPQGNRHCTGHESDPEVGYVIIEEVGDTYHADGLFGKSSKKGATKQRKLETNFGRYLKSRENILKDGWSPSQGTEKLNTDDVYRLGNYVCLQDQKNSKEDFSALSGPNKQAIADTISDAVNFASKLAYTDWDSTVRLMSVSNISEAQCQWSNENAPFDGHTLDAITLCFDGVQRNVLEKRLWSDDWVALDLDGIIIFRNAARVQSIDDLRGRFLGFQVGLIDFEGSRYSKIRTDRAAIAAGHNIATKSTQAAEEGPCVILRDGFPNTRVRPLVTSLSDALFIRHELYLVSNSPICVDGSISAKNLPHLLVTRPCSHGSDSTYNLEAEKKQYIGMFHEGFYFDDNSSGGYYISGNRTGGNPVFIQHCKNNKLLQWIALQWMPKDEPHRCLRILQHDCCISCILNMAGELVESIKRSSAPLMATGYPICIIAGNTNRLAKEGTQKSLRDSLGNMPGPAGNRSTTPSIPYRPTRPPVAQSGQASGDTSRPGPNVKDQATPIARKPVPSA